MQKYFLGDGISEKSLILEESKREGVRKRETPQPLMPDESQSFEVTGA